MGSASSDLRLHKDELARLLNDAEQPVVMVQFLVAPGVEHVEREPRQRSAGQRIADGAVDTVGRLIAPLGPSLNKMLRTEAVQAPLESWAGRLLAAGRGSTMPEHLLVTTDRFLLIQRAGWRPGAGFKLLAEIPRHAVAAASVEPKPVLRGRVMLRFTDGSFIAVKTGTAGTADARRLAEAIGSWQRG